MGKLLPGGQYQADNGMIYGDYQSAVNAGQVGPVLQRAGSGILWGLTHPVELANKIGYTGRRAAAGPTPRTRLTRSGDAQLGDDPGSQFPAGRRKPDTTDTSKINLGLTPVPPGRGPTPIIQASDEEYNRLKSQYGGPAGVEQLAMQTSLPVGFTPTGAKGPASLKDF